MSLLQLDRQDWLENYFDYNPGEHVLIVEPTGGGKTHLAYQMLGTVMERYPQLSYVSFMPKPKDPSTVQWAKSLNLRETPVWPPVPKLFQPKPAGYTLWPPHRLDLPPAERREQVGKVLRVGLDWQYKRGNAVSLVDDAHSAVTYMDLNDYVEEQLVNGRAGGAAVWLPLQKPSGTVNAGGITSYAYSSPTHFLFGRDTDERNLRRLSEIGGGIEAERVKHIVRNLRLYRIGNHTVSQKLYLDRRGPYMALIGPLYRYTDCMTATKVCSVCGGPLRADSKTGICKRNPDCLRASKAAYWAAVDKGIARPRRRAYYEANKETLLASQEKWRASEKGRAALERKRERYNSDPEFRQKILDRYNSDQTKERNLRRKRQVIDAYGGRCACCGETELVFLTIDHINGDGGAHRKELGAKTVHLTWYIKNGFPAGFQILCANCHLGKTILGACPHQAAPM